MRKIISLILIVIVLLCFVGCAELISEEVIEVDAVVTEVDRDPMRRVGKSFRPADYDIYFEYEGIKGSWDVNRETYNSYKDKIGETIKCNLIIYTYDDGTIKRSLKVEK
jgi:hypothetical protein